MDKKHQLSKVYLQAKYEIQSRGVTSMMCPFSQGTWDSKVNYSSELL